jgi:hypothetical protein
MSGFIERERTGSVHFLEDLLLACKSAFEAACKFDGMPPDTKFAIFSAENPFVPYINKGMEEWFQARRDYLEFGYCGMSIKGGRAQLYKRAPKPRNKKKAKTIPGAAILKQISPLAS